jgi:hypothetical protein
MTARRCLGIACTVVLSFALTSPAWAVWKETTKNPQQSATLAKVEQLVKTAKQPVVIFDLDSTLYKNHQRWAAIAQEFGRLKNIKQLAKLKTAQISDSFDTYRVLAQDAKLGDAKAKAILDEFKSFWTARFFTDPYIEHDQALPGAVAYVQSLHKLGAFIVYITGRDDANMRAGTVAKLKADGFPIEVKRSRLLMKPKKNTTIGKNDAKLSKSDRNWKANAVNQVKSLGTVVASFENEPGTSNLYFDTFNADKKFVTVWIDTDKFPRKEPVALRNGITTIHGFLR